MKPKKIRWIHRKFPRYYLWWWSLSPTNRLVIVGFYIIIGLLAWASKDLSSLIMAAVGFVGLSIGVSVDVCQNYRKEDLCKPE